MAPVMLRGVCVSHRAASQTVRLSKRANIPLETGDGRDLRQVIRSESAGSDVPLPVAVEGQARSSW